MNQFNSSQTIGEIVSEFPGAAEIFKKYRIDFCCGGNRPLAEAIKEQKLNESEVMGNLDQAYVEKKEKTKQDIDFMNASMTELIDYIVSTHHAYLKRELPEISAYVNKILSVHGSRHGDVLMQVHRLFHNLKTELEQHLFKEEEILFPLIKDYERNPSGNMLSRIMEVMDETESEHDAAGDILKKLREITDQFRTPEDACTTYCMTFQKLEEMESDLFQHIHLENNILFMKLRRKMQGGNSCGCGVIQ